MGKREKREKTLCIRITKKNKEIITEKAKEKEWSITDYIEFLIEESIKGK